MKSLRLFLWGLVFAAAGFAAYTYMDRLGKTGPENVATAEIGGPFDLVTHNGTSITRDDILGRNHAIFFGFTHCPDVCPTTLLEIAGWLKELGEDANRMDFYFFTVDPERDTPEILQPYVASFGEGITGVTGKPENMAEAIRAYRVYAKKVDLGDDDYTMDHSAQVMLFRPDGRFFGTISFGESNKTAIEKLRRLTTGS